MTDSHLPTRSGRVLRVAVVLAGRLGATLAVRLEHDTENDTRQRLTGLLSGHAGALHSYCDGPGGPLLCGVDVKGGDT